MRYVIKQDDALQPRTSLFPEAVVKGNAIGRSPGLRLVGNSFPKKIGGGLISVEVKA
jgi:hypothetical protein